MFSVSYIKQPHQLFDFVVESKYVHIYGSASSKTDVMNSAVWHCHKRLVKIIEALPNVWSRYRYLCFFNTIEYLKGTAPLPRLKTGNAVEFHWKETQTLEYIAKGNISWTGCKKGDPPPKQNFSLTDFKLTFIIIFW